MSQSFLHFQQQHYNRKKKIFFFIYIPTYLHISFYLYVNWFINQKEETICFAELQTFHIYANMLFNSSLTLHFCVFALMEKSNRFVKHNQWILSTLLFCLSLSIYAFDKWNWAIAIKIVICVQVCLWNHILCILQLMLFE